jgi:tetratricopeptide (TPR) repeat protein
MLALIAMQFDWDWDRAERELKLGEAEGSSPNVEYSYAFLLLFKGRLEEADRHVQRLQELDPFAVATMSNIGLLRLIEGRVDEARAMGQKINDAYPKVFAAKIIRSGCDIWEGKTDVALREIREWKKSFPPAQMYEAMAQAHAGNREEALRLIRPFEEKYPDPGVAMQWFALVYALMGDEANTVKWLGRSADRHEWQVLNLAVSPLYGQMRNSPGFHALKKRIRLEQ